VIRVDPSARDGSGGRIGDRLRPVRLGDSDQLTIGAQAIAIGSPLGLQQTVTAGIISAWREPGEEVAQGLEFLGGAVQTDAAINAGNSGGPLFDEAGNVIGVNTAILSPTGTNIGLGFAIPVNVVKRVAPDLIEHGCYRHPLLGIAALPLLSIPPAVKRELGVTENQRGLLVQEATDGAAAAGLRAGNRAVTLGNVRLRAGGDIVTAVDGQEVNTVGRLQAYIENQKRPGQQAALSVVRDGRQQEITVRLDQRPDNLESCR
jgi:2-alkenal reductase